MRLPTTWYLIAGVIECHALSNPSGAVTLNNTRLSSSKIGNTGSSSTALPTISSSVSSVATASLSISIIPSSNATQSSPALCTSSGLADASRCSSSWASWSSASLAFLSQHISTYTTTTTIPPLVPLSGTAAILGAPWAGFNKPESTCNGIPRFVGGWTATGTSSLPLGTSSTIDIIATATISAFSDPSPTCCIGSSECLALRNEWHEGNPLPYPSNGLSWPDLKLESDFPHCNDTNSLVSAENGSSDCSGCWIVGSRLQIFYWARDTESPPACVESYAFASTTKSMANTTGPVTTVITLTQSNKPLTTTTLTSPTVYMAVSNAQARDGCKATIGAGVATTIIPLDNDELKSAIITFPGMTDAAASSTMASVIAFQQTDKFSDLFGVGWQQNYVTDNQYNFPIVTQDVDINFADMGKPLPFLSYYLGDAGHRCLGQAPTSMERRDLGLASQGVPCSSIFNYYTQARIKLGTMLRSADPLWSTCQMDYASWLPAVALTAYTPQKTTPDAPIALSPEPSAAKPTLPSSDSTSTSATARFGPLLTPVPCSTPNVGTPTATSMPTMEPASIPVSEKIPPNSPERVTTINQPGMQDSSAVRDSTNMPDVPSTPTIVITIGSSTFTARQSQPLVIGTHTIIAGGAPASVGGHIISVGPSAVLVGDSTAAFPAQVTIALPTAPAAAVTITTSVNGQYVTFVALPSGSSLIFDGTATLMKGATSTINGQEIQFGTSGIVIAPPRISLPTSTPAFVTTATVEGEKYTVSVFANGHAVLIDGSITLEAGAVATTLSNGEVLSLQSSGELVIDSSTLQLSTRSTDGATTAVVGGERYTVSDLPSGLGVVVDGSITLHVGGPATTLPDGEYVLSAVASGDLLIGSSTLLLTASSGHVTAPTVATVTSNPSPTSSSAATNLSPRFIGLLALLSFEAFI